MNNKSNKVGGKLYVIRYKGAIFLTVYIDTLFLHELKRYTWNGTKRNQATSCIEKSLHVSYFSIIPHKSL